MNPKAEDPPLAVDALAPEQDQTLSMADILPSTADEPSLEANETTRTSDVPSILQDIQKNPSRKPKRSELRAHIAALSQALKDAIARAEDEKSKREAMEEALAAERGAALEESTVGNDWDESLSFAAAASSALTSNADKPSTTDAMEGAIHVEGAETVEDSIATEKPAGIEEVAIMKDTAVLVEPATMEDATTAEEAYAVEELFEKESATTAKVKGSYQMSHREDTHSVVWQQLQNFYNEDLKMLQKTLKVEGGSSDNPIEEMMEKALFEGKSVTTESTDSQTVDRPSSVTAPKDLDYPSGASFTGGNFFNSTGSPLREEQGGEVIDELQPGYWSGQNMAAELQKDIIKMDFDNVSDVETQNPLEVANSLPFEEQLSTATPTQSPYEAVFAGNIFSASEGSRFGDETGGIIIDELQPGFWGKQAVAESEGSNANAENPFGVDSVKQEPSAENADMH